MKAIYPGSFDPITYGHVDIIERASEVFDELVIVIMQNDDKHSLFTEEERAEMCRKSTAHIKNVSVMIGNGLTVDFAKKIGATILVRGIRAGYLLAEPTQRMLNALGAFSVRTDVPCPYGNALLLSLDRAYKRVTAPDPFLYHAHRAKLLEEARAAIAGDETAKNSFFQRLAIVIGP